MSANPTDMTDGPLSSALLYRYSSAEQSHVARLEAARVYDNGLGIRAGFSYKDFGDLRSAIGTQVNTGYPERDADFGLTLDGEAGRLTLAHQRLAVARLHDVHDDEHQDHEVERARGHRLDGVAEQLQVGQVPALRDQHDAHDEQDLGCCMNEFNAELNTVEQLIAYIRNGTDKSLESF